MGRPKIDNPKQQITFNLTPDLLSKINKARKHRPLSQQIREDLYTIYEG